MGLNDLAGPGGDSDAVEIGGPPAAQVEMAPYSVQQVRDAPHRASGTVMSHKEEANLFRHYGISYGTAGPPSGKPVSRGAGRTMLHKYHAPAVNHAG